MATTTHYAAIDTGTTTGTVYATGATREETIAEVLAIGDPCVTHEGDDLGPDHRPEDHFRIVPCSAAAAAYVDEMGGAPSPRLRVTAYGVELLGEDD